LFDKLFAGETKNKLSRMAELLEMLKHFGALADARWTTERQKVFKVRLSSFLPSPPLSGREASQPQRK